MQPDGPSPASGRAASDAAPGALLAAAILALLAAVCSAPLAGGGWFTSHEAIRPIARALAAWQEIAAGDPYPRWLSTGYLGKGVPLFDFYPPAFSFLVAYAHAAGAPLLAAAKVLLFLLFFLGALGTFLWVRRHLGGWPALAAGILYLFAPYHFVDLFVRGATAEFTALAALPYLFLAVDGLVERRTAGRLAALAGAAAALVVSHSLTAFMITPFAAAYAGARAVQEGGGWRALGRVVAGAALGAALAAFYWLPALAERGALSPERSRAVTEGYYSPLLHFVRPAQWLDPTWGFGASAPEGFEDGMSFQVGLLLLAAVAASALLMRRREAGARGFVLLALAAGGAALLLTSAAAGPVFAWLEPLRLVQFPWRFLGPATLFLAAAGAGAVPPRGRLAGPGAVAAVATLAVALSAPQRTVQGWILNDDAPGALEAAVAADPWSAKFGNSDEYLPRDAGVEAANGVPGGPSPWGLGVEVGPVQARGPDATFEVTAPAGPGVVVVPWHAFPGWQVTLDGREWPLAPGPEGLLAFSVPPGRHVARVRFGTTPPRVLGWALAALGVASLGALALRERWARRRGPTG